MTGWNMVHLDSFIDFISKTKLRHSIEHIAYLDQHLARINV